MAWYTWDDLMARVVDEDLLNRIRAQPCWWCGARPPSEPAHLVGRGQEGHRRADVPLNLAALCRACHDRSHHGQRPILADLTALVAARNKTSIEAVEEVLRCVRWGKL